RLRGRGVAKLPLRIVLVEPEHADAPHAVALLRAHHERPRRRRAAERSGEFAPSNPHLPLPSAMGTQQSFKWGSTSFREPWPLETLGWCGYFYSHWRMGSHTPRRFPRMASLRRSVRIAPSQIRVFPLGWRCALLMKWLKNVQMGRPLFS